MSSTSTATEKPSLPLSLLAGASVFLLTVPVGFGVFVGAVDDLRAAWAEGGTGMYLVLLLTMVSAMVAAALVTVAGRVSGLAALPLPGVVLLPALGGMVTTANNVHNSILAVAHASPADRGTIMCAALSESLRNSSFGAFMSAGLALALSVGLGLAAMARQKDTDTTEKNGLWAGAGVSVFSGVVSLTGGIAHQALGTAYAALAHVFAEPTAASPAELLSTYVSHQRTFLISIGCAALACVAGAVALRARPIAAAAFAALTLTGLAALAFSVNQVPQSAVQAVTNDRFHVELIAFRAPVINQVYGMMLMSRPVDADDPTDTGLITEADLESMVSQNDALHDAADDDHSSVALSMQPSVTAQRLDFVLHLLARRARTVSLLTEYDDGTSARFPSPFDVLLKASHAVTLSVGSREICDGACQFATVTAEALEVNGEKWPLEAGGDASVSETAPRVFVQMKPYEPLQLLRAVSTATKHGKLLTLVSDRRPETDGDQNRIIHAGTSIPDLDATIQSVKATGALVASRKWKLDLELQVNSLLKCFEALDSPPKYPVKATLKFVVLPDGRFTADVQVAGDPALLRCLKATVTDWEVTPPGGTAASTASVIVSIDALHR